MTAKELLASVELQADEIRNWRRALHRNPELSHQEKETAEYVVRALREIGVTCIKTGVGGHGVVADIDSGLPGKRVGIRADMDALPIQEEVVSDFASKNPGVMHACGHDAHTAMLLGAAKIFQTLAERKAFKGGVRLIFQPAEERINDEGKSGGRLMVEQGVMEGLDLVIGQHVNPRIEVGKVSLLRGTICAASDYVGITVKGAASHAASPNLGVDAIVISAAVIQALQTLVSRAVSPMESAVVSFGTIQGGTVQNIVADTVTMNGTLRSFSEEVRQTLFTETRRIATGVAESMRGSADVVIREGYPAVYNDPAMTDMAEDALRRVLGEEAIEAPGQPGAGAEDFAFMSAKVPGVFMRLGVKSPDWPAPLFVHTPNFDLDERCLPVGATALASVALDYLLQ